MNAASVPGTSVITTPGRELHLKKQLTLRKRYRLMMRELDSDCLGSNSSFPRYVTFVKLINLSMPQFPSSEKWVL